MAAVGISVDLPARFATRSSAGSGRVSAPQRVQPWTEVEILEQLGAQSVTARQFGEMILGWAHGRGDLSLNGNTGLTYPKILMRLSPPGHAEVIVASLCGLANDLLEIPFGNLAGLEPFTDPTERASLHRALVPWTRMAKGDPAREDWAYADLEHVRSANDVQTLTDVLDSALNRIAASHG
jgi:hypothetical protein